MTSCLYMGHVRHRRFSPVPHAFRYGLFMMYVDLAELPTLFARRWFWSVGRRNVASFNRADHVGDPSIPLDETIRTLVRERTGHEPAGPIRLLTHFRYFGCLFNPVSFYFCYDETGTVVEAIVAEITNTPWGERHCYVMGADQHVPSDGRRRYCLNKIFHISPFMGMDVMYDWRFSLPGTSLTIHMENRRAGATIFDATMVLRREELSGGVLARVLCRYPAMTATVIAAIYWQALNLWMKGVQVHPHPNRNKGTSPMVTNETHR
ncbi:MAG TPA: DUF1365 domain-containing protein, partial [Nitrospiraceae bacterium]|nr:DUF1365 domain-containing protein [Nitrospiraceae bacterium]